MSENGNGLSKRDYLKLIAQGTFYLGVFGDSVISLSNNLDEMETHRSQYYDDEERSEQIQFGEEFDEMFFFMDRSLLRIGRRTTTDVNPLDWRTLNKAERLLKELYGDASIDAQLETKSPLEDLVSDERETDGLSYNLSSMSGPLGSNLTAISMGYDLSNPTEAKNVPYGFDLQPQPELQNLSIDEIRGRTGEFDHPNWSLKGPSPTPFVPSQIGTEGGRMRYQYDYGTVIVKRHPTEEAEGKHHLIFAGCHRDGTYALGDSLMGGELVPELYEEYQKNGEPTHFQAIVRFDIEGYRREGNVDLPKIKDLEVRAFETIS